MRGQGLLSSSDGRACSRRPWSLGAWTASALARRLSEEHTASWPRRLGRVAVQPVNQAASARRGGRRPERNPGTVARSMGSVALPGAYATFSIPLTVAQGAGYGLGRVEAYRPRSLNWIPPLARWSQHCSVAALDESSNGRRVVRPSPNSGPGLPAPAWSCTQTLRCPRDLSGNPHPRRTSRVRGWAQRARSCTRSAVQPRPNRRPHALSGAARGDRRPAPRPGQFEPVAVVGFLDAGG